MLAFSAFPGCGDVAASVPVKLDDDVFPRFSGDQRSTQRRRFIRDCEAQFCALGRGTARPAAAGLGADRKIQIKIVFTAKR